MDVNINQVKPRALSTYAVIVAATKVDDLHAVDGRHVAVLGLFDEEHNALGCGLKVE